MKKSRTIFNTQDANGFNTNENKNNNGVITMKKSKTNTQDVNGFNTNDNKNNNGDDHMKLLTKKQFKGLKKGEAYTEYLSVGELADAFKYKADKAEELFNDAKKDAVAAKEDAAAARKSAEAAKRRADGAEELLEGSKKVATIAKKAAIEANERATAAEKETAEAKKETAEANQRAEAAELRATIAEGKADAGLDLVAQINNDLDELVENRDEAFERYETLGARMTGKKNRANINTGTIRHYKNIIAKCKKDIANGIDVKENEATIIELEAEIRNLQRQVDAANDTFTEMKHNKTVVSQEITKMDTELNKRYKLQGLLGELGYI